MISMRKETTCEAAEAAYVATDMNFQRSREDIADPRLSILYQCNYDTLKKYVEEALFRKGSLASEYSDVYSVAVFDVDDRGSVKFAKESEFSGLMDILLKAVGKDRMCCVKQPIGQESLIDIIGKNFCKEWQKNWPL